MSERLSEGKRINQRGWVIGLLAFSAYLVGLSNDSYSAYVVACILASTLIVGFVLSRMALSGLECSVDIGKRRMFEGQPLHLTLSVANDGSLPKWGCTVCIGVENRTHSLNQRHRWLLPVLSGGEKRALLIELDDLLRGVNFLSHLCLLGSDPLGLFQTARQLPFEEQVVVYPQLLLKPEELASMNRGIGRAYSFKRLPDFFDYRGVKEYVAGDDLRLVHWRSTARRGQLVVKLPEREALLDYGVVLEVDHRRHHRWGEESSLEYALRAAASLIVVLQGVAENLRLITSDGKLSRPHERQDALSSSLLEHLARCQVTAKGNLSAALKQCASFGQWEVLLVITPNLTGLEQQILEQVELSGTHILVILIDREKTASSSHSPQVGSVGNVRNVGNGRRSPNRTRTLFKATNSEELKTAVKSALRIANPSWRVHKKIV